MRLAIATVIAFAGASLTGCTLYFGNGGDDDPPVCDKPLPGYGYEDGAAQQQRDPYTNTCGWYGGGGGGNCYYDDDCNYVCNDYGGADDEPSGGGRDDSPPPPAPSGNGSDPDTGTAQTPPLLDYPMCETRCDSLSENDCLATSNCQATYSNNDYAYPDGPRKECGGLGNLQCGPGYTCVIDTDYPYPDAPGYCESNGGTMTPPSPGVPVAPTSFAGCYSTGTDYGNSSSCYGLDAFACVHRDDCSPVYDNYGYGLSFDMCIPEPQAASTCDNVNCGPNAHCEQECITEDSNDPFTECVAQCVPDGGSSCATVDCAPGYTCTDVCDTMDPTANGMTVPGQCWASCQPTESCAALDTQTECDGRSDCTSVFDGENCTCYPGGFCDCEILTWKRCDSLGAMPL